MFEEKIENIVNSGCKSIECCKVLKESFAYSCYNPKGKYLNVSFCIKSKEDAKKLNDALFNGCEVLKLE